MKNPKISFWIAIIININVVIGGGFFLGAQHISVACGLYAPLVWLACGILLFPLVIILTRFAKRYPEAGGLYVYSQKLLGAKWGLLSGWGYFIGNIAGNAVLIHAFATYLQKSSLKPVLATCSLLDVKFDILLVLFFTLLTLLNVQFFAKAQILFTVLKFIPIAALVIGAITLFNGQHFATTQLLHVDGLFDAIPMVLFAYIGFEACCSVVDQIKDHKNGHRAIFLSFIVIVLTYTLLQLLVFCIYGSADVNPFLNVLARLTSNACIVTWGNTLIYCAILSSFLGGFYGTFYCNNWNLFAIAQDKKFVGSSFLIKQNKNGIPWVCVLIQTSIVLAFLITSQSMHHLVTMNDFGVIIAYILSSIAFLILFKKSIAAFLSLGACLIFLLIATKSLYDVGVHHLIPFLLLIGIGMLGYVLRAYQSKKITGK
ncbi:MAG: APC family permease [bacterium]